jgi:hypothetical protein
MALTIADFNNAEVDLDHIADVANSPELTATDREGHTKRTLAGVDAQADELFIEIGADAQTQRDAIQAAADVILAAAGYAVPVPYAAGLNMTVPNQTVSNGGQVYAPKSADLPFVTSGVFEAAKFRLIQGVAGVDLLSGVGAAMVGFQQLGVGAILGDVMRKLTDIVDIFDFIPKSEHAAIRAGTSVYDCHADIMEAINSRSNWTGIYVAGPSIYFPAGKYTVGQAIQLKKVVKLWSGWSGISGSPQAQLSFPAGSSGVVVHRHNTMDAAVVASTTAGDGSMLEGLQFVSTWSAVQDAMGGHGLWMRARAVVRNCMFSGFSGDGGRAIATSGGGGAVEGNCNGWFVQACRFQNNGAWGWQCAGADANAGTGIGIDCSQNGSGGIFDNSFLGNTYIQPQVAGDGSGIAGHNTTRGRSSLVWFGGQRYTAVYPAGTDALLASTQPGTDSTIWAPGAVIAFGNPTHPLWVAASPVGTYFASNSYRFTNVNSRGMLINPYEEGGYSSAYSTGPTLILGGALSGLVGFSRILGGTIGPSTPGTFTADKLALTTSLNMLDTSGLFSFEIFKQASTTIGRRASYWANSERDILTLYDRGVTVANGYPREFATGPAGNAGTLGLGNYYWGSKAQMKYRGLIAAAPGAGLTVLQGDTWEALTPAAAGKKGWTCTTAGTTGSTAVIKQYGAIDA